MFGGLSVIAVGDLFQLKPVFDGWVFKDLSTEYSSLALNIWKNHFTMFELDQVMRQKDDAEFANILNRLRIGQQTEIDIRVLKERLINKDMAAPSYPLSLPHIFTKNEDVHAHNNRVHDMSPQMMHISINCSDVVIGDVLPEVKTKILNTIPSDPAKTMGILKKLETAVGQRVEMCCNVDVEDGLVNGAGGEVKAVTTSSTSCKPDCIWIKFNHDRVGTKMRQKYKRFCARMGKGWTPVSTYKRQFKVGRYQSAQVMREQFPLRPASAKTAHRCQGCTMDAAVVDLGGYTFPHAHYVALSRVTSLNSLYIRDLNEKKIKVDCDVKKEMDRLRTDKTIDLKFHYIYNRAASFIILFQNVRSLGKHIADIQADKNYSSTDMNIFVETKLSSKDKEEDLLLPGYSLHRFDWKSSGRRPSYGIAVYCRRSVKTTVISHGTFCDGSGSVIEHVLINVQTEFGNTYVVCLYSSPKCTINQLVSVLENIHVMITKMDTKRTIIFGDFNIDLLKFPEHGERFLKTKENFRQCVRTCTTDYYSLLDHVYTNIEKESIDVSLLESHFTDHKGIVAYVDVGGDASK